MKILVDTHILIWSFDTGSQLRPHHRQLLQDAKNEIYVSDISLMEISLKKASGKLGSNFPAIAEITSKYQENGFFRLPLTPLQIDHYQKIIFNPEHKDPFDRYLVTIASFEGLSLMTDDSLLQFYKNLAPVI